MTRYTNATLPDWPTKIQKVLDETVKTAAAMAISDIEVGWLRSISSSVESGKMT